MRLIERSIKRDGSGFLTISCDNQDDLWRVYNIVESGDCVKTLSDRKLDKDERQRVREKNLLEIKVIASEFDSSSIRFRGVIINEEQLLGRGHSLEINLNKCFTLTKKKWTFVEEKTLKNSVAIVPQDAMAAVVMYVGVAHICVFTREMMITKAKIEMPVSRKRVNTLNETNLNVDEFFQLTAKSFIHHIDVHDMKAVIVAGHSNMNNAFLKMLWKTADSLNQSYQQPQKAKFVVVPLSSGCKQSVKEILDSPQITGALTNAMVKEESKVFDKFMDLVNCEPTRTSYGFKQVSRANEYAAIDTLMISDTFLHSKNSNERKLYENLVEDARQNNAKIITVSNAHTSVKQLDMMTGIVAILRYPLVDVEDDELDNLQMPLVSKKFTTTKFIDDVREFANDLPLVVGNKLIQTTNPQRKLKHLLNDSDGEYEEEESGNEENSEPRPYMTLMDFIVTKHKKRY